MKYNKWSFVVVPNIKLIEWKSPILQTIFLWMCKYSNDEWFCFPSLFTLSKNVWVSKRTIINYIKQLEDLWLIKIENRYNNNEKISNVYYIILPSEPYSPPSEPYSPPSEPGAHRTISTELKSLNSENIYSELEKYLQAWNYVFDKNYKITPDLINTYKSIRLKYTKEDLNNAAQNYYNNRVKNWSKEERQKFELHIFKFLKQKTNWFINYI